MAPRKQATTEGETAEKKARAPQRRRFWFFFDVVDENGNVIPGAKVRIQNVVTNVNEAMEIVDANRAAQYVKHEITAKQDDDAAA